MDKNEDNSFRHRVLKEAQEMCRRGGSENANEQRVVVLLCSFGMYPSTFDSLTQKLNPNIHFSGCKGQHLSTNIYPKADIHPTCFTTEGSDWRHQKSLYTKRLDLCVFEISRETELSQLLLKSATFEGCSECVHCNK